MQQKQKVQVSDTIADAMKYQSLESKIISLNNKHFFIILFAQTALF